MGYFNSNNLGHITSITTNTCELLQDIATRVIQTYLQGMITTAVSAVVLLLIDIRIGLISIGGVLLFLLVNRFMQKASIKVSPRKIKSESRIVDAVLEYIQGIGVVKSFNLSTQANKKVDRAIDEASEVFFDIEKMFIPFGTWQSLILKLFGTGVILASVLFYLNGTMNLMYGLLMIIFSFMLYSELERAGLLSALLRIVDLSVNKVETIFESQVMDEKSSAIKPERFDIVASNVGFSYDTKKILDNVSFTLPENTTTAIVGPSGGGKTTACHLIARFWDVDEGSISIGGKDVRDYKLDDLLANISMVFQNVYLFNDTVANNIKFGKPEASIEQVEAAAKKACCHEFITQLPEGYDTIIGEGGATISGGEKQRIAIARAILKDAPIIILDEATANVDPENEKLLQTAIEELTRHKTIIMIAHRLKTVRHADQILVLNNGKIVQSGTHASLTEQGGMYADFVAMREKSVGWKLGVA
jgi:ATP-binding cassette subfamily B protein